MRPRYIIVVGVLGLFFSFSYAQIKPKQLKKEIMQGQVAKPKTDIKGRSQRKPKPMPAAKPLAPIVNPLANRNVTLVYLENSEVVSFDQQINPDVQILKGNVRFRHDNAVMYCDSAYFYEKANQRK